MAEDMKDYTLIIRFRASSEKGKEYVSKCERLYSGIGEVFEDAEIESYTLRAEHVE